jgi:urease accessory protein
MTDLIRLTAKSDSAEPPNATLTLPWHQRIKSRLRVTLDDGREAGVLLERGATLQPGDLLTDGAEARVRIQPADESLSCVTSDDPLQLARACYHLGNRHMTIQIERERICYLHDHVLDDMLRGLGLTVTHRHAPFEPEPGAYGGSADKVASGHHHHHSHDHGHNH